MGNINDYDNLKVGDFVTSNYLKSIGMAGFRLIEHRSVGELYSLSLRTDKNAQDSGVINTGLGDTSDVYELVEPNGKNIYDELVAIFGIVEDIDTNIELIVPDVETIKQDANLMTPDIEEMKNNSNLSTPDIEEIRVSNASINTLLQNAKDPLNTGIATIEIEHYEIHEGHHFFYAGVQSVNANATMIYTLQVGAKPIHFIYAIYGNDGGISGNTYENVVANNDGTLIPINNNNRVSTTQSLGALRLNPTGLNITGSVLLREFRAGTGGTPATRSSGSVNRGSEVILKANTKYSLSITNLSSSANNISVDMSWYEL